MGTARVVGAEWREVLPGRVGTGAKEGESSTGRVWGAVFHHVTARSRLARVLKLMNRLFLQVFQFCFGPRILYQSVRGQNCTFNSKVSSEVSTCND
jgi:hypothetical protein